MAKKKMHPKILELRNKVGYKPIYEFTPSRKKYEEIDAKYKNPVVNEDENPRKIKQYFCIWGVPDDYGTRPIRGCFGKSISERGPESNATNKIIVLNQHDQRNPLCKPLVLKEDEIGLYGEYIPDEGITSNDELVLRVKKGTINGGSYGFDYVWDMMEWNEKDDCIDMHESILFEVSPVSIPSQLGTFVVRSKEFNEELQKDTNELLKKIPRALQLEMRSLISRHISLAQQEPNEQMQNSLKKGKSKNTGIDYQYLIDNL